MERNSREARGDTRLGWLLPIYQCFNGRSLEGIWVDGVTVKHCQQKLSPQEKWPQVRHLSPSRTLWSEFSYGGGMCWGALGRVVMGCTLDHTLMKVMTLRRWEGHLPAESSIGLEMIEI